MFIDFITYYLVYLIVVSLIGALVVWRFGLPRPSVLLPALAGILFFPALIVYFYSTYFTSIPEVMVPELKGKSLEEAFEQLKQLSLNGRHSGMVYDMKYEEGMIVSQRPESGRTVKTGRTVYLITSSGKRRVAVPNLLGRPAEQAEAVLAAKGLRLGEVTEEPVPDIDPGVILTQLPLPGEEVDTATYVSITVSASGEFEMVEEVKIEKKPAAPKKPLAPVAPQPAKEEEKKDEGWWFWPW